jgi:ABC-type phosphate transport system auxiliary subunit
MYFQDDINWIIGLTVLICAASIAGFVFKVVGAILIGKWVGESVERELSRIYRDVYQPEFQQLATLFTELERLSQPERRQRAPQAERALQHVEQTYQSLPRAEKKIARPNLDGLRAQWRRMSP